MEYLYNSDNLNTTQRRLNAVSNELYRLVFGYDANRKRTVFARFTNSVLIFSNHYTYSNNVLKNLRTYNSPAVCATSNNSYYISDILSLSSNYDGGGVFMGRTFTYLNVWRKVAAVSNFDTTGAMTDRKISTFDTFGNELSSFIELANGTKSLRYECRYDASSKMTNLTRLSSAGLVQSTEVHSYNSNGLLAMIKRYNSSGVFLNYDVFNWESY